MRIWSVLALSMLSACGVPAYVETLTPLEDHAALQAQVDALQASLGERVDTLEATVLTLSADNADLRARLAVVENELVERDAWLKVLAAEVIDAGMAPAGVAEDEPGLTAQLMSSRLDDLTPGAPASCTDVCVTDDELDDALAALDLTTEAEVASWLGFSGVGDRFALGETYATVVSLLDDVGAQGATVTALGAEVDALQGAGFVTQAALAPYATVTALTDATSALDTTITGLDGRVQGIEDSLDTFATEAWVLSQGFQTEADLAVYATDADLVDVTDQVDLLFDDVAGRARIISAPEIVRVPADAATVQDALASLDGALIVGDGAVDIVVQPAGCGAFVTSPIVVDHVDGARITIRSELGDPNLCVLQFDVDGAGVRIAEGRALGALRGFTLSSVGASTTDGLVVAAHAALLDGSGLIVEAWPGDGVRVENGGYASLPGLLTGGNSGSGLAVDTLAVALADGARSEGNGGYGYVVARNGWLTADTSAAVSNHFAGYIAYYGGFGVVGGSAAYGNGNGGEEGYGGFISTTGGGLDASGSWSAGNDGDGFHAREGALLFASGTRTDNAEAFDGAMTEDGNTRSGYVAIWGSYLNGERVMASQNDVHGVVASYGSAIRATRGAAVVNGLDGFASEWQSVVAASEGRANENGVHGYTARLNSALEAITCEARSNGGYGVYSSRASWISADNLTLGGNGLAGEVAPVPVSNPEVGSFVYE